MILVDIKKNELSYSHIITILNKFLSCNIEKIAKINDNEIISLCHKYCITFNVIIKICRNVHAKINIDFYYAGQCPFME